MSFNKMTKRLFLLLCKIHLSILIGGSFATGCNTYRQDYNFSEEWNSFYKFHYIPADWDQARVTCEQEGAVLATPYSLQQTELLQNVISALKQDCGVYIGVRESQHTKGDYRAIDGTPLCRIPHQWATDEPNSIADSCLALLPDGTLADEPCTSRLPFICYKKNKQSNSCRNLCQTKDTAYKFDQRTGSCYKFHNSPLPWGQAVKTCSFEGGHLAIINSAVESEVLKELFAQHPPESLPGTTHTTVVHIGFHNLFQRHDWWNLDGKNLTTSGFDTWSPGQPDNAGNGENCGSIFRNGLLNDLPCSAKDAFICEIEVTQ